MSAAEALATLPMYDWPELRRDTDTLWDRLRDSLRDSGFPAPEYLTRDTEPDSTWRSDRLLLGQTCGLPFVCDLADTAALVGTPAYDIECGAGSYYSAVVVRTDCQAATLDELDGLRFAYNSDRSQSGYHALAYALLQGASSGPSFVTSRCTGSHRASIRMVAEAEADVAAIDGVTWEIALRHEPASRHLRVMMHTEPTPGLPFICARHAGWNVDRLHMAVIEAMASLDADTRHNLLLTGFAHTMPADYRVIRQRYELTRHMVL